MITRNNPNHSIVNCTNDLGLKEQFVFGTQYYRSPTPPSSEWEKDFQHIKKLGLNIVKMWMYWGWYERQPQQFTWDDSDRFFDLARQYDLKVVPYLVMEVPPSWLKINHPLQNRNGKIRRAHFLGIDFPCFDDPAVREAGSLFIEKTVKRYRNDDGLLAWGAWNEHRRRRGECTCPISTTAYQQWLKEKFKTIEHFNTTYGKCYHDWDAIRSEFYGNEWSEEFLFIKWSEAAVQKHVKWVIDIIRKHDTAHAVLSQAGSVNIIGSRVNEPNDDMLMNSQVDFYGTSYPIQGVSQKFASEESIEEKDLEFVPDEGPMICDWMRGVSPYNWVSELYPNASNAWANFEAKQLEFWLWEAIASGTKGILFWQFKPERLAVESLGYGLVTLDGENTERSEKVSEIATVLQKTPNLFNSCIPIKAKIAILYNSDSALLSEIENTKLPFGNVYRNNIQGLYRLFRSMNISVDFLPYERLTEANQYPVLWVPYCLMLTQSTADILKQYVEEGNVLISEPNLGLRDVNTWVRTGKIPSLGLNSVFGCDENNRRQIEKEEAVGNVLSMTFSGFSADLALDTAKPLMHWAKTKNVAAAINLYGKGKAVLLGGFPGLSYYSVQTQSQRSQFKKLVRILLPAIEESPAVKNDKGEELKEHTVRFRHLRNEDGEQLLFVFNYDNAIRLVDGGSNLVKDLLDNAKVKPELTTLAPRSVSILYSKEAGHIS